ncbi:NAD-dependent protein deacylase [Novipirellula galeiformis]|uniref:NAD-dependent protein deacylase n=1 Tax=Novipirellula galeiformis TaxID=2528004 RepID=A0A5C6CRF9_9BACT|nr:NAD-dependent deacylase [Novipirellula galeiformis]TWU27140.1 NAD-dependent protein deacylase [Novipirellula galeiformis]
MNILILTGAGISAESGVPTFRDANGLWEGHRFEDVATPQAFRRNPSLVHHFYNQRRRSLLDVRIQPNPAHRALAEFEAEHRGGFLLVTQNIDDLHVRAGSKNVLAMHGELLKARCETTEEIFPWRDDLDETTTNPNHPEFIGTMRPHVVWFGEMPLGLARIEEAARNADLFIAIGTSAVVYPAAGIVRQTKPTCRKIEINLDATPNSSEFDQSIRGKASIEVPAFLKSLASG